MKKSCIVPYIKPTIWGGARSEVTSALEELTHFELGYLSRPYGQEKGVGWEVLTACDSHEVHGFFQRQQFLQTVLQSTQQLIQSIEQQLVVTQQGDDLVISNSGFDEGFANNFPVSTLILSPNLVRTFCSALWSLNPALGRFEKTGNLWMGIEGINRIRFLCKPGLVFGSDEHMGIPTVPLLMSDCCDLYTRQPSLKLDDSFPDVSTKPYLQ